jgi:hypothetical protein
MDTFKRFPRWLIALASLLLPCLVHAENYSDIWWNPSESGWGVTIADHETQLVAIWYTYDTDGSPTWFGVQGGTFNSSRTFFSGDLYRATGPSYTGAFNPAAVSSTKVGTASFEFASGGQSANFTWTVGSVTRSRQIQRLPFGSAPANWPIDRTDMWWNPAENGWGLTLAQHGNNTFAAWFTYGPSGRPLPLFMSGVQAQSSDAFTGTLYTTTGTPYNAATYDPAQFRATAVGSVTVHFSGDTATFAATVNGVTYVKTITRFLFGGAPPATLPVNAKRVEDSSGQVTFNGSWTRGDSSWGWSGGTAMQSATPGASASITFTGTSIRWIGARGRGMGIATVSIDGGPPKDLSLFARPTDEIHTPIVTISDLGPGQHMLTITVTGRPDPQGQGSLVVVDAFDIDPGTTVSHWQDTNPGYQWSGAWSKSSVAYNFSGTGVSNVPELPVSAQETQAPGAAVTVPFRGTEISWIGYRGPDAGIATVRADGGAASEVDLWSPIPTYQPIVFTATGLADANHALTITATGRKNAQSSAARIVVDAFDVITPGRRYEEYEPSITYVGKTWTPHNDARVWSEGATATSNEPGSTATFRFTGTSVSWIGCQKGSAGGVADVYIDGVLQERVKLNQSYPIEGYQMTVFRKDGLPYGAHTLVIQVVNTDGSYVVVDAFDVR